jgi:hypothetical protein
MGISQEAKDFTTATETSVAGEHMNDIFERARA